jgi:asparagine synthetase B (glutamine-hydrolysing)
MRWLEINGDDFSVVHEGFDAYTVDGRQCFVAGTLRGATCIEALKDAEYAQLVIVDAGSRSVSFGRDYLGHYPLTYARVGRRLIVSDSYARVCAAVRQHGGSLTLSEEATALYFSMGFVPHGMSLFREVVNCKATGCYRWTGGREVDRIDWFEPIAIRAGESVEEVGAAIRSEVERYARESQQIDIWCSGGLDSSIMAMLFNESGRRAEILTLGYGSEIHATFGDGERRFARLMADHAGANMRDVDLGPRRFDEFHTVFTRHHNGPVMDFPLPPKYALAETTRDLAITGEAGDTFFGGTKNAAVMYAHHKQPAMKLGLIYALAHERQFKELPNVLRHGNELSSYVIDYCDALVARYPGDLQRKLFYLNTHEKLGSMIFAQSYFPSQLFGVRVRHPIASLSVYRAAFALPDHRKFSYPKSKIALVELFGNRLPAAIVNRKKSGTQLPIRHNLERMSAHKLDFTALRACGLFNESFLDQLTRPDALDRVPPLLAYACITFNSWINQKELHHADAVPA